MKYGLMELFQMHHSETRYGVASSDRLELFGKAKALGFDGIEFGLQSECSSEGTAWEFRRNSTYAEDPLWTGEGDLRQALKEASDKTGVEARSLCLHLLNYRENSPASEDAAHRVKARQILEGAMEACHEIGASVILVPFFGTATLETREQMDQLVSEMRSYAPLAESLGVCLALETTLDAPTTCDILEEIHSEAVQVYFDTGNTAGRGYDILREIQYLGGRIVQVHIKDSPAIPSLENGRVDFRRVIQTLQGIGYQDYLVLELPTLDDETMQASLSYLKRLAESEGVE